MTNDKWALLLAGPEQRFEGHCNRLGSYLSDCARFPSDHVRFYPVSSPVSMADATKDFFSQLNKESPLSPAVIFYNGHGLPEGFQFTQVLAYSDWVRSVNHQGPLFFLFSMCHAGAIVPALQASSNFNPEKDCVLTSSSDSEVSYNGFFVDQFLESYSKGLPFSKSILDIPPEDQFTVEAAQWLLDGSSMVLHRCTGGINAPPQFLSPSEMPPMFRVPYRATWHPDGHAEKEFKYTKLVMSVERIQHPVRFGASLDYLLFKQ